MTEKHFSCFSVISNVSNPQPLSKHVTGSLCLVACLVLGRGQKRRSYLCWSEQKAGGGDEVGARAGRGWNRDVRKDVLRNMNMDIMSINTVLR